jgi:neutral ceramidase
VTIRGVVAGMLTTLAAGCAGWHPQPLPVPVSPEPIAGTEFRAGFARVDLTPPSGVGLAGSGPEGRRSTGYRTRLYASAMVLEDAGGERMAFVVVDLAHVSTNIHRLAADRLVHTVGIGADRLIVSATHTHSGPSHFYGERQYNESVSRLAGYDPRITDLIVSRIADAVSEAAAHLRSAVVGYERIRVDGVSWNRSLDPHCENGESAVHCESGDTVPTVDRSLFMLRVDEVVGGRHVPMGSFSVFPLHPTALPSLNTLLDGDTHVRIMNALADRTRARYGRPAVHLFANGAEGDVAPDIKREQCDIPVPGVFDPVPMPRGPGELVDFLETDPARVRHCVTHGVDEAHRIADLVTDRAFDLYVGLEDSLSVPGAIRRSFTTEWLPGHDSLCAAPEAGSSTAAGADSVITRIRGWRWIVPGLLPPLGLEEGGKAVQGGTGCQRPKRTLLGAVQTLLVVGENGLPKNAQITAVRLDSLLLGAVPAEVTTVAGFRMRRSMAEGFGGPVGDTVLIGLANGFLQYVTTEEEYQLQHYEGGSTLYGPGTAAFLGRRLSELTRTIATGVAHSPPGYVGPITAYPGDPVEIVPSPRVVDSAAGADATIKAACDVAAFTAEWEDLPPGRIFPRDTSSWVVIQRVRGSDTTEVAKDGDGRLEISAVKPRGKNRYLWRAWWLGQAGDSLTLLRRGERPWGMRRSPAITCPRSR